VSEQLQVSEVPGDVASVVARLTSGLRARQVEVFATIDHAAGARRAGLELADEVLLVFGNPAVGTALMQADPRCGIDLPLRVLVWSQDGVTRVAHEDPTRLADRYAVASEQAVLGKLAALLEQLVAEAGRSS
jgi:uncharacterized protein (DUF302 family)